MKRERGACGSLGEPGATAIARRSCWISGVSLFKANRDSAKPHPITGNSRNCAWQSRRLRVRIFEVKDQVLVRSFPFVQPSSVSIIKLQVSPSTSHVFERLKQAPAFSLTAVWRCSHHSASSLSAIQPSWQQLKQPCTPTIRWIYSSLAGSHWPYPLKKSLQPSFLHAASWCWEAGR